MVLMGKGNTAALLFEKWKLFAIVVALFLVVLFFVLSAFQSQSTPLGKKPAFAPGAQLPVSKNLSMSLALYGGSGVVKGSLSIFNSKRESIALDGVLKARVSSGGLELFSSEIKVKASDFQRKKYGTATNEAGRQKIVEHNMYTYFFEFPGRISKGVRPEGTLEIEFVSSKGERLSSTTAIKGLPLDPEGFAGNPDELLGPMVRVDKNSDRSGSFFVYETFFELREKSVFVSSAGTLEVSAENPAGKKIYSRKVSVKPGDFSFKLERKGYGNIYDKKLKYAFSFSSRDLESTGECVSKVRVAFSTPSGTVLRGETTRRYNCYLFKCGLGEACKNPHLLT